MADKKDEKDEKKDKKGAAAPSKEQLEANQAAKAAKKAAGEKGKGPKVEGGEQVAAKVIRLRDKYKAEVVKALQEKFGLKNPNAVPRLTKVCLNMGYGKAATDNNPKVGEQCLADMTTISGQKAVPTVATKSVSNFKLREGLQIGCRVTLRGPKMYEFLDRLFNVALPRVRDFRGVSPRSFDGRGNYSLGIKEQSVFPEIDGDKIDIIHGMDITICTTAKKDEHARELLKALGCPFRDH
ncbi:MAG TPA: 50S ribosomal protein L5 [Planctomycetota bacterium]|nr:50S ribosomal protein L5 [Planctomycetota bacterium]